MINTLLPFHVYAFLKRIQEFLKLPAVYRETISSGKCNVSKLRIIIDLLYIFFKLKTYPQFYNILRLWEKSRSEFVYYYGEGSSLYARRKLRASVQDVDYQIVFDDKYLSMIYLLGLEVPQPRFLGVISGADINHSFFCDLFDDTSITQVIVKPLSGTQGKGVFLVDNNEMHLRENYLKELEDDSFELENTYILQERVQQHDSVSSIYGDSLNTIRFYILYGKSGIVTILGAIFRFGRDGNIVDNVSAGGIAVSVDVRTGKLDSVAYDKDGNQYCEHPSTGFVFEGYRVPFWPEILELIDEVQQATFFYRWLGYDIAITSNGPLVIEINANPQVGPLEMFVGPLLKNENIYNEFKNSKLLYSKAQENIKFNSTYQTNVKVT